MLFGETVRFVQKIWTGNEVSPCQCWSRNEIFKANSGAGFNSISQIFSEKKNRFSSLVPISLQQFHRNRGNDVIGEQKMVWTRSMILTPERTSFFCRTTGRQKFDIPFRDCRYGAQSHDALTSVLRFAEPRGTRCFRAIGAHRKFSNNLPKIRLRPTNSILYSLLIQACAIFSIWPITVFPHRENCTKIHVQFSFRILKVFMHKLAH